MEVERYTEKLSSLKTHNRAESLLNIVYQKQCYFDTRFVFQLMVNNLNKLPLQMTMKNGLHTVEIQFLLTL